MEFINGGKGGYRERCGGGFFFLRKGYIRFSTWNVIAVEKRGKEKSTLAMEGRGTEVGLT